MDPLRDEEGSPAGGGGIGFDACRRKAGGIRGLIVPDVRLRRGRN